MHVMYKFKNMKISRKHESLKQFQTPFCLVLQTAPDEAGPKARSLRIYQNITHFVNSSCCLEAVEIRHNLFISL